MKKDAAVVALRLGPRVALAVDQPKFVVQAGIVAALQPFIEAADGRQKRRVLFPGATHEEPHRQVLVGGGELRFPPEEPLFREADPGAGGEVALEQPRTLKHRVEREQPAERAATESAERGVDAVFALDEGDNLLLDDAQELGGMAGGLPLRIAGVRHGRVVVGAQRIEVRVGAGVADADQDRSAARRCRSRGPRENR